MDKLENKRGITLVAVVVTIIILLILTGITLAIANDLILNKADTASTKTIEAMLQERIEMAYMEVKASYWSDFNENNNLESIEQNLKEILENTEDFENVTISKDDMEKININFLYKNKEYNFAISKEGEIKQLNFLKGNVKIGDYVEYPIEYTDVYSNKHYTSTTGWRVIDDGIMEGTSGYVRIISTGIPVKWFYDMKEEYVNNETAINALTNDFENITLQDNSINGVEMQGSYFKDERIADRITTLSLADYNLIHNALYKTNRELNDISPIKDSHKLLQLEKDGNYYYYWLSTAKEDSETEIYCVSDEGIQVDSDVKSGIRPVIYLKNGLEGKLENNVWKIVKD